MKKRQNQQKKRQRADGWFTNFKKRSDLHNIKFSGEAASADKDAADKFCNDFKEIMLNGDYSPKQIFNCDETGLFWKQLPDRTFISKKERHASGHKARKDRVSLLLGANVYGDFKFKPFLIHHSENPRCLKA
jgi:hypothetical protein